MTNIMNQINWLAVHALLSILWWLKCLAKKLVYERNA